MDLQTKTELVREHLLTGKHITSLMAFTPQFRINTRLSDSIFRLRGIGMDIKTGRPDDAFIDGVITNEERQKMNASLSSNYAVYYIIPSRLEENRKLYGNVKHKTAV